MAARRLPLRKPRQILRLLWHLGLGVRETARASKISHTTVLKYRDRAEEAGLSWDEPSSRWTRRALSGCCFRCQRRSAVPRPLPDWGKIQAELRLRGVTLQLLWGRVQGFVP